MRTNKPISTVSYNTDDFLQYNLNRLLQAHKIEYWCYVRHLGETADDGSREKDHKHVYIIPNGRIDTMDISDMMLEVDKSDVTKKPLRCMDFRHSKEDEWFLYNSHDPDYLKTKYLVREYTYKLSDFVSSDDDETRIKWDRAYHESDYMRNQRMLNLLQNHSASQLVSSGFVQPKDAFAMQCYYKMLCRGRIEDNRQWINDNDFEIIEDSPF